MGENWKMSGLCFICFGILFWFFFSLSVAYVYIFEHIRLMVAK